MSAAGALWPHLAAMRAGYDACERELLDIFLIGASLLKIFTGKAGLSSVLRVPL